MMLARGTWGDGEAVQDDEAAYVIESCQGRLRHARNPSARPYALAPSMPDPPGSFDA